MNFLEYQRYDFAAQLPQDYWYTSSHHWIARQEGDLWRVGLTKLAVRLLGEMVDSGFQVSTGQAIRLAQPIGWIEGFKSISDLLCVVEGEFAGENPALLAQNTLLSHEPQGAGWIYEVRGQPDPQCLDARGYREVLDRTLDGLLRKQKGTA